MSDVVSRLQDTRRRLQKAALGVGVLGVVAGASGAMDVAFALGFAAAVTLLVDEKLRTNTWSPWGDA